MKFTKFGKALLMGALSAGVALSISSCVESYSVGFLYVTGTESSDTTGAGIISGFKIDHNTGQLTQINGLPISSGGANPVRAVLLSGSRFLYVLNRGTAETGGGSDCTTANPCQNSNITLFAVGANGILSQQAQFSTQGTNPFRLLADSTGSYLYVLDHDAPMVNGAYDYSLCTKALGTSNPTCADITVFKIDSSTGRLSLVQNQQVATASGAAATYFPVPSNPVDFVMASSYIFTMNGSASTDFPYSNGTSVFPYTYNSSSGQLTINQTSSQTLNIASGRALVYTGGYLYVLDNDKTTATINGSTTTSQSGIVPYTVGTNGVLQIQTGGAVPDDPNLSSPTWILVEASKGRFAYVANEAGVSSTTTNSGIAGYSVDSSTKELTYMADEPFGSGNGPQCLVEDPSNQFIYTANTDKTITGRSIDLSSGDLRQLTANTSSYSINGPATWCLVDGRTD